MKVIPLLWDSAFFGIKIAKVEVFSQGEFQDLLTREESLGRQYDLLYVFATPGLNSTNDKMQLVDKKAVFTKEITSHADRSPYVRQWDSTEASDELKQLALSSGKHSRFKRDCHFPSGGFERLYTHWIEQSVNHTIATDVFCYFDGEVPIGMVTLDLDKEKGQIGLVAVNEKYRKRGIGLSMMQSVIDYTFLNQGKKLSVVTQLDNEPACRLYQKCGFSLRSVTEVWHWWL